MQQIITVENLSTMEATVLWLGNGCLLICKFMQVAAGARELAQLQNPKVLMKESLTVTFLAENNTHRLTFLGYINGECTEKRLYSVMFIRYD